MAPVLLVTGGGSRASVLRSAVLAAREGYDVAVNFAGARIAADAVAADVAEAGRRAVTVQADITDPGSGRGDVRPHCRRARPVTAFVSNAGIIHKASPLADMDPAEIRRVVDTDLTAHLVCCGEAVRRMSTRRGGAGGAIVLISSRASGLYGAGGFIPYGAAKGGIDVLAKGLGREVAGEGIRVNALRPGLIDTDIQAETGIEDRIARFGPSVPMGRAGTADEVAQAALWLLSAGASYVTGTLFDVSGGR